MAGFKSPADLLALLTGHQSRWEFPASGVTTTYSPASGKKLVLMRVVLNTNGGAVKLSDTSVGEIGTIAADAPETTFWYGLPLKGNLKVENGGSNVTIVYDNR